MDYIVMLGILVFFEVFDDDKELLIKWEMKLYVYCIWFFGVWVYGIVVVVMWSIFGKYDV